MSVLEEGTFWDHGWPWLLPTPEFLFWFKVEPRGFSYQAYIGSLVLDIINLIGLFIPLWLSTGKSLKSFGKAFVILMARKPERTYIQVI